WGTAVDGLACRLTVPAHLTVGQAIPAVIEVKNTSNRKRYIYPQLDPQAIEHLTLDITGPEGRKVPQRAYGKGYGLGEKSFQPLAPGGVQRFDVIDLRRYFPDLEAFQCYPAPKENKVASGKYVLEFRFRSPKVPARFVVSQTQIEGRQVFTYKDAPAELV